MHRVLGYLGRLLAPKSKKVNSPAGHVAMLQLELSRTLGFFTPSHDPVILSPLSVHNPDPNLTGWHEQTHWRLTHSTPYGRLYGVVASLSPAHIEHELLDMIVAAQWLTQEGTATYGGLSNIALDKAKLDDTVSRLPSEMLGQPPYREAYDLMHAAFPLAEASDLLTIQTYSILIEAVVTWALSGDILERFERPASLTAAALRQYLAVNAPDVRLPQMLKALRSGDLRDRLVRDVRETISNAYAEQGGYPNDAFWVLVDRLHPLCPDAPYLDEEAGHASAERFVSSWTNPSEGGYKMTKAMGLGRFDLEILPELRFESRGVIPWTYGLADLDAGQAPDVGVDEDYLRDNAPQGLLLTTCLAEDERITFRPTVYPLGDDGVNPTSPSGALFWVTYRRVPLHICDLDSLVDVVGRLPLTPNAVSFLGHTWTHWDARDPENKVFQGAIRFCVEPDLSEPNLLMLLVATGLFDRREFWMIETGEDTRIACFYHPEKPDFYLLQLVDGEVGHKLFMKMAQRNGFSEAPVQEENAIAYYPLIYFIAITMASDMVAASPDSDGMIL